MVHLLNIFRNYSVPKNTKRNVDRCEGQQRERLDTRWNGTPPDILGASISKSRRDDDFASKPCRWRIYAVVGETVRRYFGGEKARCGDGYAVDHADGDDDYPEENHGKPGVVSFR